MKRSTFVATFLLTTAAGFAISGKIANSTPDAEVSVYPNAMACVSDGHDAAECEVLFDGMIERANGVATLYVNPEDCALAHGFDGCRSVETDESDGRQTLYRGQPIGLAVMSAKGAPQTITDAEPVYACPAAQAERQCHASLTGNIFPEAVAHLPIHSREFADEYRYVERQPGKRLIDVLADINRAIEEVGGYSHQRTPSVTGRSSTSRTPSVVASSAVANRTVSSDRGILSSGRVVQSGGYRATGSVVRGGLGSTGRAFGVRIA